MQRFRTFIPTDQKKRTFLPQFSTSASKRIPPYSCAVWILTIWSFWLITQVDRSIEPMVGIRGNGCDSSQHHRTSRTNSIQITEIAEQKKTKPNRLSKLETQMNPRSWMLYILSYLFKKVLLPKYINLFLTYHVCYSCQTKDNASKTVRKGIQEVQPL